ncbi:hypothetical protein BWQ96_09000 [Gracilariopsis chorda]|uniref:Uncharacterized protein n=1 Tax=Gracilariopsis chorda TaxID=448386 RepID=A0A2V3IGT3_9FLOR|nr:hypothetical protein BWQ96_09000 [Gracilariopsis chorda]|eukprot:PXF41291.1 hypothetical protein BWQ96_09000 [Gracilariopsis chorda]
MSQVHETTNVSTERNPTTPFPAGLLPSAREQWASTDANLFLALITNLASASYANYLRECGSVLPPNECLVLARQRLDRFDWDLEKIRSVLDHIFNRGRTDGMLATFNPKFVAPLTCTSDAATAKLDYAEMGNHFLAPMYVKSAACNQITLTDFLERKQFLSTNMMMMIPLSTMKILQLPIMAHQFWLARWVFSQDGEFDLRAEHLSLSINECSGALLRKPSQRFGGHAITAFEKVHLMLDVVEKEFNSPDDSSHSENEPPGFAQLMPHGIDDCDHETLKIAQYRPYDFVGLTYEKFGKTGSNNV